MELQEEETSKTSEDRQCEPQIGKVLGVPWSQATDLMGVSFEKVSTLEHEPTQRGILRIVAAISTHLELQVLLLSWQRSFTMRHVC